MRAGSCEDHGWCVPPRQRHAPDSQPLPSVEPAWDLADEEELDDARVLPALDSWDLDGFAIRIPSLPIGRNCGSIRLRMRTDTEYLAGVDRWSLSDKQVYGAEDDDDMDAIMQAIDNALRDDQRLGDPSLHAVPSERWAEARAVLRRSVAALRSEDIPTSPGVYIWFRGGEPVYVGEARGAKGLRRRLAAHRATGRDLSRSTLRASVAVAELGVDRAAARRRPSVMSADEVAIVNSWLAGCDLGWIECSSPGAAHALETALREEWLPPLNRI